ncbi:M10 family metallopeptidase C-terminal domain-containing protein [Alcaligenaceae bacterium]|nr:M10 family metallopeptidase C-terminal domain-containing protein [Alcaligenaceae bacterium]
MTKPYWTDEQVFNQLNSGEKWAGPIITYTFPDSREQIHFEDGEGVNFTPLTAEQREYAKLALATWNDLIAPNIVPGSIGASNMEFGNTYMVEEPGYAHAYYPPLGSIWFSYMFDNLQHPVLGNRGFTTYIHEIGHALGLNHMGDYNGDDDDGPSSYQDSGVLSIMSYYGPEDQRGKGDVMWGDWFSPDGVIHGSQTPMLNDIMVIQAIYGAANTRADNTVYGFGSTVEGDTAVVYDFTQNVYPILTFYDAGGIDTLNLSGWGTDSDIDLRPGQYSSANGMTNNLAIAHGVIIENLTTGAGNDALYGNQADNTLDGGAGQDWAYFSGVFSNYSLDYDLSGRTYTVHDTSGADGTDTLINIEHAGFENFGGNLNDLTPTIHRFFNTNNGTHFFTASNDEASDINTVEGLIYEGIGFERNVMPDAQSITVHGFHNDITDTHFYTANNDEAAYIIETGDLTYEGVAFQAYAAKTESTTEVYRFYDTSTNSHFYTANATEMENVKVELAGIYTFEGVAFYTEAA